MPSGAGEPLLKRKGTSRKGCIREIKSDQFGTN